jgi:hypothetical protein
MHKGFKCLDISSGQVYIYRDVVFDKTEFPFSKLHPNARAHLREKISLLPQDLLNSSELEQLGDHVTNLLEESDIFCGRFDVHMTQNAANMGTGATRQENAAPRADSPAASAPGSMLDPSRVSVPPTAQPTAGASTLLSVQPEAAVSPTGSPTVSPAAPLPNSDVSEGHRHRIAAAGGSGRGIFCGAYQC